MPPRVSQRCSFQTCSTRPPIPVPALLPRNNTFSRLKCQTFLVRDTKSAGQGYPCWASGAPPTGSFESMRHQATHPRTPVFWGAWTQQHVGLALSGDFCVIGVLCQGFRRDAADLGACLTPCEEYVATRSSIEIRSDPRAALFSSS